ncbi:MAG: pitrilysin family protein [Myxococcota bacterium]
MLLLALTTALAEDPFATEAQVHVLDNGLTVLLHADDRTDTIALHLTYGVGSRDERPGEFGCAHLFEHLMFEGSANVPRDMFDTWLTAGGGENNAWTSNDETTYHMTFPSNALDLALFLESDRMGFLNAGLTEENLTNQQKVVLQERAEYYSSPNGRDDDALGRLLYPVGHGYHSPIIGTVADIKALKVQRIADFWMRHYRPRNAVLALVGNLDEGEALAKVRQWFGDVPDRGAPEPRAEPDLVNGGGVPELQTPIQRGKLVSKVEERTLYLAWSTVPHGHPDEPALDLLSWILDGGQGTRLADRLYWKSKLTNDMLVTTNNGDLSGQFMISATSPRTKPVKLEAVSLKVLRQMMAMPPTPEELNRARQQQRSAVLDSLEAFDSRAEAMVDCYRSTGQPNCLAADWARYEAVTSDDVVRVIGTWLDPNRMHVLAVVPTDDNSLAADLPTVELP